MSILSGYKKFKRYILTDSGYKLCSLWTSGNTVHLDNGKTLQNQINEINTNIDEINSDMGTRPTSDKVKHIIVVSELPSDASSHSDTMYIIPG